ncbi:MAG: hypothetical protein HYU58_08970 [Proteobacteria bacterium]|nr:hypothetical protein [Pseudomonadota bacterium]
MSSVDNDRNFRGLSGNSFQVAGSGERIGTERFATAISIALREEYGGTHAAVKTVVTATQANERAVKNWFQARNGPSGESLVALCRHSDRVLETVLAMADRSELLKAKRLVDTKGKLLEMMRLLEEMEDT